MIMGARSRSRNRPHSHVPAPLVAAGIQHCGDTGACLLPRLEYHLTAATSLVGRQVVEETVADDDVLMIKGSRNSRAVTVLLRGANDYLLDEMDRSLHDAFCIVKRVLESGAVVPGAHHVTCLV